MEWKGLKGAWCKSCWKLNSFPEHCLCGCEHRTGWGHCRHEGSVLLMNFEAKNASNTRASRGAAATKSPPCSSGISKFLIDCFHPSLAIEYLLVTLFVPSKCHCELQLSWHYPSMPHQCHGQLTLEPGFCLNHWFLSCFRDLCEVSDELSQSREMCFPSWRWEVNTLVLAGFCASRPLSFSSLLWLPSNPISSRDPKGVEVSSPKVPDFCSGICFFLSLVNQGVH